MNIDLYVQIYRIIYMGMYCILEHTVVTYGIPVYIFFVATCT